MSKRKANLMDAVQWTGVSHKVTVRQIPKPTITHPLDAVVRLTSAGICGTELHLYRGRWPNAKPPLTLGHEMVGIVDKVGSGVTNLKVGDRVLVYDSASCGFCDNCTRGLRAYCQTLNPPFENEFFGIPFQGIQLDGGQGMCVPLPTRTYLSSHFYH
jgi:glutathione-independent formaldehyde dehydrogenase